MNENELSCPSLFTMIGLVSLAAFAVGLWTRRYKLTSVLGAMLLGCAIGPTALGLVSQPSLDATSFISQLTLAFVAFSIGIELRFSAIRRLGPSIVSIIFSESLVAFFLTTLTVYLVTRDLPMALVFGAMAPASAPAGTVAVIQEEKAKGPLTTALYAVVGFDDGLAILIFAFAAAFAENLLRQEAGLGQGGLFHALEQPTVELVISTVIGLVVGSLLAYVSRLFREDGDVAIVLISTVILVAGLAPLYHGSLILANLVVGLVIANRLPGAERDRMNRQISSLMSYLFIIFFALAGAQLDLKSLPALGLVGLAYIIGRTVGLIGGAWLGAVIGRADDTVRKYLGLGILSQAGVAIGLSLIVNNQLGAIGSAHAKAVGSACLTSVTATSVFFGIIGPILTRYALVQAGEIRGSGRKR